MMNVWSKLIVVNMEKRKKWIILCTESEGLNKQWDIRKRDRNRFKKWFKIVYFWWLESGSALNYGRKGVGEVKVSKNNNDSHFGQVQYLQEVYMELAQLITKLLSKANGLLCSLVYNW